MNEELCRIHLLETVSTNAYAKSVDSNTLITLITSDYQTSGRGQRGNSWESARGKNLLLSFVVKPINVSISQQFMLCELISICLCDVLSQYVPEVCIKWPNDIYYRDKKLCGVLIEHDVEGGHLLRSIIGVGLNVNQSYFVSDAPNPVSLLQVLGNEIDREMLLDAIVARFMELYHQCVLSSSSFSCAWLHQRYVSLLYRRGVAAMYRDAGGVFVATLCDVALNGTLVLVDAQGHQRRYLFKEVAYVV